MRRRKEFPVESPSDVLGMTIRAVDKGVSPDKALEAAKQIAAEYKAAQEAKRECVRTTLSKRGHGEESTTDPRRVRELLGKGWKINGYG